MWNFSDLKKGNKAKKTRRSPWVKMAAAALGLKPVAKTLYLQSTNRKFNRDFKHLMRLTPMHLDYVKGIIFLNIQKSQKKGKIFTNYYYYFFISNF